MSQHPPSWREYRSRIDSPWVIPLHSLEWTCKWSAHSLKQWAFLDVLDRLGRLTILIAVITWLWGIPARQRAEENQRQAKIYQAWQVINTAYGKPGSGGRAGALYDLIAEGASLAYVDLSHANLTELELPGQNLEQANFQRANLLLGNLNKCNLQYANFRYAELVNARFNWPFAGFSQPW